MDNPAFSIITVCYNSAQFIEACIKSVISQDYKNIEYIIVDGLSDDGTLDIINKYRDKISVIISEKDAGHIYAMNKGIQAASGEIIYILNSDDTLFDQYVISDIAKEFIEDESINFLYGKVKRINLRDNLPPFIKEYDIFTKNDLLKDILCHQGIFAKKSLYDKVGLLDTKYKISADYDWMISVFEYPNLKIRRVDRCIAVYSCAGICYSHINKAKFERLIIVFRHFPFSAAMNYFMGYLREYFDIALICPPGLLFFLRRLKSLALSLSFKKALKYIGSPGVLFNSVKYKLLPLSPELCYSPLSLTLWITDRCNLKCNFCLKNIETVEYRHKVLPDMTLETFQNLLKIFKFTVYIQFIGQGEPLLNKDIFSMINYGSKLKKEMTLVTNGTLLDRQTSERLINYGLLAISVSLKAISAQEYEENTGCDERCYYNVLDGVRYLVESKRAKKKTTKIMLSFILCKSRLKQLPEVIKLAESLGVDILRIQNLIPFGEFNFDKKGGREALFRDDQEVVSFLENMKKKKYAVDIFWPVLLYKDYYCGLCSCCFDSLSIDAAGNISFCDRVLPPSAEYGNVFKDKDAWNLRCFKELRKKLLLKNKDIPDMCKFCVELSKDSIAR